MGKITMGAGVSLQGINLTVDGSVAQYPDVVNTAAGYYTQDNIQAYVNNSEFYAFIGPQWVSDTLQGVYRASALSSDVFELYRKTKDDPMWVYLGTVNNVSEGIYDFNVNSGDQYSYMVTTNPDGESAISLLADKLYINNQPTITPVYWNGWTMRDLQYNYDLELYEASDIVFNFKYNVQPGDISQNLSVVKYDTLGQYARVIQNNMNYASGGLSCLFANFDVYNTSLHIIGWKPGQFYQKIDDIYQPLTSKPDDWDEYYQRYFVRVIENGVETDKYKQIYGPRTLMNNDEKLALYLNSLSNKKKKLLKAPNGDSWIIAISDSPNRNVVWEAACYPETVSFNWVEVDRVKDRGILRW